MKPEIEDILRADCSEHVMAMTFALTQGKYELFDLYHDFYKSSAEMLKTRGKTPSLQMDLVVAHLYNLRHKK